jgi:hypothetical protein
MKRLFLICGIVVAVMACNSGGDGSSNPVDSMNKSGTADTASDNPMMKSNSGNGIDTTGPNSASPNQDTTRR